MSESEIAAFNQFILALHLIILVCLAVIWLMPTHCGSECKACRPDSKRKH